MTIKKLFQNVYTPNFKGRAKRKEFILQMLFNSLLSGTLFFSNLFIFGFTLVDYQSDTVQNIIWIFFLILPSLLILTSTIAIHVKRLHDINISGYWIILLIMLNRMPIINIIGTIPLLFLIIKDSSKKDNKYGKYIK